MENTKPLIQQLSDSGELTPIYQNNLRTYYTCVRYSNIELFTSAYSGPMGTPLTYYGPGQWSCVKGWVENYDYTFKGKRLDFKVMNYCKFRDTVGALKKELGEEFVVFTPK